MPVGKFNITTHSIVSGIRRPLLGLVLILCAPVNSFAQEISFSISINKDSVKIGEPFELTYSLTVPASVNVKTVNAPSLRKDSILQKIFEIWNAAPVNFSSDVELNGLPHSSWNQTVELASFESGFLPIEPLTAIIGADTLFSNALLIYCEAPELNEKEDAFYDIKEIHENPLTATERLLLFLLTHRWWIFGLCLTLVLLALGVFLYEKRKRSKNNSPFVRPKSMQEKYMELLDEIIAKQLWQKNLIKEYHTEITLLLRAFIAERFHVPTFEKTTDEIIALLRLESISAEWKTKLNNLLSLSDLVKFAKGKTSADENEKIARDARAFILEHLPQINSSKEEKEDTK